MRTVKFKDLPEKVVIFLCREVGFAYIGEYNIDVNYLHNLPEWSKATDEERLAYAQWRYKEGTKFKNLNLFRDGGKEIVSSGEIEISSAGIDVDGNFLYYVDVNSFDPTQVNKWAEIIEEAKPEKEEQPEFKAGDKVTLDGSDANTVFKIIHIEDEMAWIKAEGMMFGRLVMLNRLRKHDPDKAYREIAKEFLREKVYSFDNLEHFTVPKQGLIELVTEAIKKGKEL